MLWFKHFSNARNGNSLNEVMAEMGSHVGYACYFWLLEHCAQRFTPDYKGTKFSISEKNLKEILKISAKKTQKFLEICQRYEMFSYEKIGNVFVIDFPKLLEIKDEWMRKLGSNSGVTPEKLRRKSGVTPVQDGERDGEREGDDINTYPPPLKKEGAIVIDEEIYLLAEKYSTIRKHELKKDQLHAIQKALKKKKLSYSMPEIMDAVDNYKLALQGWYSHKFNLWDFLKAEGAYRFYGNSFDQEDYQNKKPNKGEDLRQKNLALV